MLRFLYRKLTILLTAILFVIPLFSSAATLEKQLAAKKQQIEDLQKQIQAYQSEIKLKESEAKTLEKQINLLADKIRKVQSEIKALGLAIDLTGLEIIDKEQEILERQDKINNDKGLLAYNLWLLYQTEETNSPLVMFIKSDTISDFLSDVNNLVTIQESIVSTMEKIKDEKKLLEGEKGQLENKQQEQEKLKSLQEMQQREVTLKKTEQNVLLGKTQKKRTELISLLNLSQEQINKLRDEIYYLQRNGVSLEDAVKYGQIVAERAGIRPAFLLALLEVESGMGTNIGSGRYKTDMNPNQWDYFFKITKKLGLDPEITPVSKKPSYGWGGAMGAAQFLPGTWLGYEADVARLTGHNPPSPWQIEDSFMAAALKLARDGASNKTESGELAAAKKYLSGNPKCTQSICNWYANLVLDKAAEIEKNLTPDG
jgi:peptidoglycan hydrolase CwlO-like protein